ncbi:MAG: type II secretion system GspH family protein [Deferribacteraceae bacterium]|jgi:prepilin-type N-terminal cleavage/methylation domain-containing protein|nr:type II secretion system GspH family protein [Deferribacteraceae bacterium]
MKRGFNLIELAVVFLLIGLISAMVYKGKELLENASIRAEVHKLSKLRNAFATMMTTTSKGNIDELEYDSATGYKIQPLFDLELIAPEDLTVQGSSDNWSFYPCINNAASFSFDIINQTGSMICALHKTYPVDLICNTEVMNDNQNLSTGLGVAFKNSQADDPYDNLTGMVQGGFDCDLAKPSAATPPEVYGFILYR